MTRSLTATHSPERASAGHGSLARLVGQRRQGSSAIWLSTKIDRMGYIEAVTESGYPSDFSRTEWLAMKLIPSACASCGAPARLRNEDGQYCLDCMKLHLLEKSLVQITELARPK